MTEDAEQNKPRSSSTPGKSHADDAASKVAVPAKEGPGRLGLDLSRIRGCIRDLDTDKALTRPDRDLLRSYYTRESEKLHLKLTMLEEMEKIHASELGDVGKLPVSAESLARAKVELQKAASALEGLSRDDAEWEMKKASARRWELTRKWEAITPDELKPAVEGIRHEFEHKHCWRSKQCTMKLCFAALHPSSPNDLGRPEVENLQPYKRFLVTFLGPQVEKLLLDANHPAPTIFKSYIDVLETALRLVVRATFEDVLQIAKAQTDLLILHPVEWARRQMGILISAEKGGIRAWIKEVCDPPDFSLHVTEDSIFWGSWRAPRLIHMRPAGNTRYEQAAEWTREALVKSGELLEARAEFFTEFLRIDLDEVARAAHIEFAKHEGTRVWAPRQVQSNERIPKPSPPTPVSGAQPASVWRSLYEVFRELAEEELRLVPNNVGDRWLRAFVDYGSKAIEHGQWHLSAGANESFRERFRVEATRAGIALKLTVSGDAGDLWLHHVFSDLRENKSNLLLAPGESGGIIARVCEASAIFCARLERETLVNERNSSASVASHVGAASSPNERGVGLRKVNLEDPRAEALREAVIRKVQNPHQYNVLSVRESALYFNVQPRTIYRWCGIGDLRAGGRRGSISIESVLKLERRSARKHRNREE